MKKLFFKIKKKYILENSVPKRCFLKDLGMISDFSWNWWHYFSVSIPTIKHFDFWFSKFPLRLRSLSREEKIMFIILPKKMKTLLQAISDDKEFFIFMKSVLIRWKKFAGKHKFRDLFLEITWNFVRFE